MFFRSNPALLLLLLLMCPLSGKAQDTSQQNSSDKTASKSAATGTANQPASASGTSAKAAASSDDKQTDPKNKFAFPEAISRKAAAEAAREANAPDASGASSSDDAPAGVSSSRSGDTGADAEDNGANGSDISAGHGSALTLRDAGSNADVRNPYRAADDDNVADFYYKNGNYMGAYMRYKDAIHYMPDDAKAQYGLAKLEEQFGQNDDAIKHYNAFLKLESDGSKARDARRALKKLTEKVTESKAASKNDGEKTGAPKH
ncbi:MAG: tetratricopeptide repeat protein [Acidobacteriaceae bacterium]